jgi:Helix-turn-helix domain (DUF4817)
LGIIRQGRKEKEISKFKTDRSKFNPKPCFICPSHNLARTTQQETMEFTLHQKGQFILLYERCGRSWDAFRRAARRELDRRPSQLPPRTTFLRWFSNFEATGLIELEHPGKVPTARTEENIALVKATFEQNPHLSTRRAANAFPDLSRLVWLLRSMRK